MQNALLCVCSVELKTLGWKGGTVTSLWPWSFGCGALSVWLQPEAGKLATATHPSYSLGRAAFGVRLQPWADSSSFTHQLLAASTTAPRTVMTTLGKNIVGNQENKQYIHVCLR
eukprot:357607-Chlamydomonas_euryale.AAC.4